MVNPYRPRRGRRHAAVFRPLPSHEKNILVPGWRDRAEFRNVMKRCRTNALQREAGEILAFRLENVESPLLLAVFMVSLPLQSREKLETLNPAKDPHRWPKCVEELRKRK